MRSGPFFLLQSKDFTGSTYVHIYMYIQFLSSQQETAHKLFYMTVSISIFRGEWKCITYTSQKPEEKHLWSSFRICPACNEWFARFYGFPDRPSFGLGRHALLFVYLFFSFLWQVYLYDRISFLLFFSFFLF